MTKTMRSISQWTCFSQVVLCALLLLGVTTVAEGQIDRLDHFRCYDAEGPPANSVAILQDQFDLPDLGGIGFEVAFVLPVFRFCNPVTKIDETGQVTDIVDRRHHLTMY